MKRIILKLTAMITAFGLSLSPISNATAISGLKTSSNIDVFEDDDSSTIEAQDYEAWTKPITSYFENTDKGLMGVRYIEKTDSDIEGKIVVTYYDDTFHITDRKVIPSELPIWGGFAASTDAYYLVTGQKNENESASTEVIRITKYDKNWQRISSAGAKDCNVYEPFAFATVRMDFYNQYLILKTGRLIYLTPDGAHHQVQLTLEVDTENMTLVNSGTDYGYVSHSLNQFIKADNDKIISVEQGDSYPRGIILFESENLLKTNFGNNNFADLGKLNTTTIFEVPEDDDYYQNLRASIGALEISDSNYLVAGNSVIQDENRTERVTRNIFVLSKDKNSDKVQTNWLTSYEEGDGTVSTPHMVKISNNNFMVLWSRNDTVYYTLIDGTGKQIGQIYQHEGHLSDCQPILINDKIYWYTVDGVDMDFYTISTSSPSDLVVTKTISGHQYEVKNVKSGTACLLCSICGHEENLKIMTDFSTWWNTVGTYESYMGGLPDESLKLSIEDKIYFWITFDEENINTQMDIKISNPNIVSYTATSSHMGYFTALADGTTKITISPKWNPNLSLNFKIKIGETEDVNDSDNKENTEDNSNPNNSDTKLAYKSMKIKKGKKANLALLNNSKKVVWKILSGKKCIALKNKSKTGVTIKGIKKGTAQVQAKIGKKKYICTIKVI